ncbi:MAG: 30S ribosomal protein S2, partial [Candidatus Pacebacteria bacterium CG_4_10_14_0_8_um_filter_43_12]
MNIDQLPDKAPEFDLAAMLEAGVHFGHQSAKWHPHMKEWIYMEKDGVHIFDLAKTAEQLKKAYNVAYELGKSGKTLVVVGTKRQVKDIILDAAQANKVPY